MSADKGVTPGLLDRNFVESDREFDSKLRQVSWADASNRSRKSKAMTVEQAKENLSRVQECRPLGPPGTKAWAEAFAKWNASR